MSGSEDDRDARKGGILPSEFLRQRRPEYYSDTEDHSVYLLDEATLGYQLETVTDRNETHKFEVFCRKLCERRICPNLRPQTGPEGGGDSKADSETYPVSKDVSRLWFVGEPAAAKERWAFAFSAKRKWSEKIRADVKGLVETGRPYSQIICVTSRFARAKTRANTEDELSEKYGVPIIHDRSWIIREVMENDQKDLAYNYLGAGQIVDDPTRLGPSDYSRRRQLTELERALADPGRFAGMERQQVTEALLAATLSRNLELPRVETDGRFQRAIRLADEFGTFRQRLEARYEHIRAAYWWFDDIAELNRSYDDFAALVLDSSDAIDLELLSNILQLLFNSVIHRHLTPEEANLDHRTQTLRKALQRVFEIPERPNNSLVARTSLLFLRLYQAMLKREEGELTSIWREFSDVLHQARGMSEYAAERLVQMIETCGDIAGDDVAYSSLVEELAQFVADRKGEAEGGLILLKRTQQLDFDRHLEMIRLLGKAARALTKHEYTSKLIEALQLLSLAYRSAGLLWAARATITFACASVAIESERENELRVDIIPTMKVWVWIAMELRHLPDLLSLVQLLNGCLASLPLAEESKLKVAEDLREIDMSLACQIANFDETELLRVTELPDLLGGLGLETARTALMFVLGYEDALREEGTIPSSDSPEAVAEFFSLAAGQPAVRIAGWPLILNAVGHQILTTSILGMRVTVSTSGSEHAILVAEAVLASIEAFFATTLDARIIPHTEMVHIDLVEESEEATPAFVLDPAIMKGTLTWPTSVPINSFAHQEAARDAIFEVITGVLSTTCMIPDAKETITHLFQNETVADRLSMIALISNSHHRFLRRYITRLGEWQDVVERDYPLRPVHPVIIPRHRHSEEQESKPEAEDPPAENIRASDHRKLRVRSVINIHLWDQAKWRGTAYLSFEPSTPPGIALMFSDGDAARKIFEEWRARFGQYDENEEIFLSIIRGISAANPFHYRVLITSKLPEVDDRDAGQNLVIATRMQTMEPANDVNLERFLADYRRSGGYYLLPAVGTGAGEPELLLESAIAKRQLSVRNAWEIGEGELEFVGLDPSERAGRRGR